MIPTDMEDFLRGYADAEEDVITDGFNIRHALVSFYNDPPDDAFQRGYFKRLCEEIESWV